VPHRGFIRGDERRFENVLGKQRLRLMTQEATTPRTVLGNDRFARWPIYSGLAVVAICCFVFYWPVTQIAFSIIFIFWAAPFALAILGLLAIALWCGLADLFHGRWRRSISMLAFPAMLIAAIPASIATDYGTSWLTFVVNKSRYVADVRKASEAGKHFLLWDWGGNVMIGSNRFLVWDAEDEVALPNAQQTQSWTAQFPVTEYRVVRKLEPHFYLIDDR
jgi:hypothetical protein